MWAPTTAGQRDQSNDVTVPVTAPVAAGQLGHECSISGKSSRTQSALATACMGLPSCAKRAQVSIASDQSAVPAGPERGALRALRHRKGMRPRIGVPATADASATVSGGGTHETKHDGVLSTMTVDGVHIHVETVVQPDGGVRVFATDTGGNPIASDEVSG